MLSRKETTVPLMAFSAGLAHTLRLYGLQDMHDEYAKHLLERSIKVARLEVFKDIPTARRPGCTTRQERELWIRDHILSTKDRKSEDRSLRVSHGMLSRGSRERRVIGSLEQLAFWAALWDDANITVAPSCGGLGLFATEALRVGQLVARGEVDNRLWWPELDTLIQDLDGKCSAMFGPISLMNAACGEHANADFVYTPGRTVKAVITRPVKKGEEIVAQYPSGGRCVCTCWCGRPVEQRKMRSDE